MTWQCEQCGEEWNHDPGHGHGRSEADQDGNEIEVHCGPISPVPLSEWDEERRAEWIYNHHRGDMAHACKRLRAADRRAALLDVRGEIIQHIEDDTNLSDEDEGRQHAVSIIDDALAELEQEATND